MDDIDMWKRRVRITFTATAPMTWDIMMAWKPRHSAPVRQMGDTMSHYAVLVETKPNGATVDELLAPYDENVTVAPYVDITREHAIEIGRKQVSREPEELTKYKSGGRPYSRLVRTNDKVSASECYSVPTDDDIEYANELVESLTDDEAYVLACGDSETDVHGNILSTYNPDSKWDWYAEGGRFSDMMHDKDGEPCSKLPVSELDVSVDPDDYAASKRFFNELSKAYKEGDNTFCFPPPKHYIECYADADDFATQNTTFCTYAVVTPDGIWHAPGDMGWFACSSETADEAREWNKRFYDAFIGSASPDTILNIVDCHI